MAARVPQVPSWAWWLAGGVGVAAAGFAWYFWNGAPAEAGPRRTEATPSCVDEAPDALTQQLFDHAVKHIASADFDAPRQKKLRLYALFKQAQSGTCTAPQPGPLELDFTKHAKWKAWSGLGGMPRGQAMQGYVALVDELCPRWRGEAGLGSELQSVEVAEVSAGVEEEEGDTGMSLGPSVSRMDVGLLSEADEARRVELASPLQLAVENMDVEQVRELLAAGADPNASQNDVGESALHVAVDHADAGSMAVVTALIEAGADVNAGEGEAGETPLMYAVMKQPDELALLAVKTLLAGGADAHKRRGDDASVLDVAVEMEASEAVQQELQRAMG